MWWWIITGVLAYLAVAFGTFRVTYTAERADSYAQLELVRREEVEWATEYMKTHSSVTYKQACHFIPLSLSTKRRHLEDWINRRDDLKQAYAVGVFWPLIYLWRLMKVMGRGCYWVLFKGDIDRKARAKAQVLIAQKTAELEHQKTIALSKRALEEEK